MIKFVSNLRYLRLIRPSQIHQLNTVYCFGGGHAPIDREKIIMRDQKTGYYLDPNETARRIMRVISQFDKVNDPQSMTLNSQWYQLGLNELDTVQLLVGIEEQFRIQFPDDVSEKFKDINDVVEYVARSFYSQ